MNKITTDSRFDSRESELEELFKNAPKDLELEVKLPSGGRFYEGFIGAKVTPLLFEDERKILSSKSKDAYPITQIIAKCVHGIPTKDILLLDKIQLLLKIKEVSYGSNYNFSIVCPRCSNTSEVSLDVSKAFNIVELPKDFTDPQCLILPHLQVQAKVRMPRISDEAFLSEESTETENMFRFVTEINGNSDPVFIAKALKRMHIRDLKTIHNAIHMTDMGVDTRFQYECHSCKHNQVMAVPFDANFFSVS